jgi:hypothetical protein
LVGTRDWITGDWSDQLLLILAGEMRRGSVYICPTRTRLGAIHSMELLHFKSGSAGTLDYQILVPTHTDPSLDELTILRVEFADQSTFSILKKVNLILNTTYFSITNLNIGMSKFLVLEYVISSPKLILYGTEGIWFKL